MRITKSSVMKESKPDTIKDGLLIFPTYICGGQFTHSAERHYEGWYKGYRVIACLFTRRNGDGWGKGKLSYFIDGEKKQYKNCELLMDELNKRTLQLITE